MRGNSLEGTNELIFEIGIFFFFFLTFCTILLIYA